VSILKAQEAALLQGGCQDFIDESEIALVELLVTFSAFLDAEDIASNDRTFSNADGVVRLAENIASRKKQQYHKDESFQKDPTKLLLHDHEIADKAHKSVKPPSTPGSGGASGSGYKGQGGGYGGQGGRGGGGGGRGGGGSGGRAPPAPPGPRPFYRPY